MPPHLPFGSMPDRFPILGRSIPPPPARASLLPAPRETLGPLPRAVGSQSRPSAHSVCTAPARLPIKRHPRPPSSLSCPVPHSASLRDGFASRDLLRFPGGAASP